MKNALGSIVYFLVLGLVSCNSDEAIEKPFDEAHLIGKWQESGRNGIVSPNDNFYEFRDSYTFEQCLEGGCHEGVWEWIVDGSNTKIKFNYSEPTGGWWQEFEISYLDDNNMEVTVFDYIEGKEDPVGGGVEINFSKIDP